MMTKFAQRRLARHTALKLGKQGISVPLSQLEKIVEKLVKKQKKLSMPPETAVKETNDIKVTAFEAALALHQSMIDATPEYLRGVDVHKWPQMIRGIYYQILKDLQN